MDTLQFVVRGNDIIDVKAISFIFVLGLYIAYILILAMHNQGVCFEHKAYSWNTLGTNHEHCPINPSHM